MKRKVAQFTDHDGALLVIVAAKGREPLVYAHRRLCDHAANGSTCEGCGYRFSKHDAQRRPMYDSVPLHKREDPLDVWLVWCQECMDGQSASAGNGHWWYTGRSTNRCAPTENRTRRRTDVRH